MHYKVFAWFAIVLATFAKFSNAVPPVVAAAGASGAAAGASGAAAGASAAAGSGGAAGGAAAGTGGAAAVPGAVDAEKAAKAAEAAEEKTQKAWERFTKFMEDVHKMAQRDWLGDKSHLPSAKDQVDLLDSLEKSAGGLAPKQRQPLTVGVPSDPLKDASYLKFDPVPMNPGATPPAPVVAEPTTRRAGDVLRERSKRPPVLLPQQK